MMVEVPAPDIKSTREFTLRRGSSGWGTVAHYLPLLKMKARNLWRQKMPVFEIFTIFFSMSLLSELCIIFNLYNILRFKCHKITLSDGLDSGVQTQSWHIKQLLGWLVIHMDIKSFVDPFNLLWIFPICLLTCN